ncbi:MAG: Na+/H+ antiporter NhaA [Caldilineae bacterium]|nr:Na+/H+ antiporter NhaA [Chloroflexota bacterium]MCB9177443.1 Na+/H+ antiporter NhaA [Caldilineae bacterium]
MASPGSHSPRVDSLVPALPSDAPADGLVRHVRRFFEIEALGGILLVACALTALIWANSPWRESYQALWQTRFGFEIGGFALFKPLLLWINDGLMAVFFFVVGLEIKREARVGDLASPRKAALPVLAALGGMAAPAGIYLLLAPGHSLAEVGWGVPMATDIAFALGVLLLLGKRVPLALKLFLTAVAIVDDIGAVLVIALFYTERIAWAALAAAALLFLALRLLHWLRVRRALGYAVLGALLWLAVLKSGVHATVAGVLVAMAIPVYRSLDTRAFLARSRAILDLFEGSARPEALDRPTIDQREAIRELELTCEHAETPLARFEYALHPWVTFVILPLFALANAGVSLDGGPMALLLDPVSLAIIGGLVLGKPIGIFGMSWLAVRLGLTELPEGLGWRQVLGASCLAGIGFTMALFIAGLAFGDGPYLDVAKVGILTASLIAALVGVTVLLTAKGSQDPSGTGGGA